MLDIAFAFIIITIIVIITIIITITIIIIIIITFRPPFEVWMQGGTSCCDVLFVLLLDISVESILLCRMSM